MAVTLKTLAEQAGVELHTEKQNGKYRYRIGDQEELLTSNKARKILTRINAPEATPEEPNVPEATPEEPNVIALPAFDDGQEPVSATVNKPLNGNSGNTVDMVLESLKNGPREPSAILADLQEAGKKLSRTRLVHVLYKLAVDGRALKQGRKWASHEGPNIAQCLDALERIGQMGGKAAELANTVLGK